ncbi:hypothetical protein ACET65_19815 [Aeromonas rivipollensis]
MNLPAGVTRVDTVDVAPKSNPMSTEGINALAKQRRREAEEMEALLDRRRQAEREEQEERERIALAQATAAEKKRQEEEQERQKWVAIAAAPVPKGSVHPVAGLPFERVVVNGAPVVPMLVGDDLVIKPLGLSLEVFALESPIVPQGSADLLLHLYIDEAQRRWDALLAAAMELLGDGNWLYTSALPTAVLVDAGPVSRQTERPSATHKIVRATWGDCYIHNTIHKKD